MASTPFVNVKDMGAKGDGTTNDTDAINAVLVAEPFVVVPPGDYRIDGTLQVSRSLWLVPGARLWRKAAYSTSTAPVVLVTDRESAVTGGGWVMTDNDSPEGVVRVGPQDVTQEQILIWNRVDGIKISGKSGGSNVGLNLDSSEPGAPVGAGKGANYNGNFSNLIVRGVDVGVKVGPICNGHTFSNIFFYLIGQYSYQSIGNSENTFFGGFTHHSEGVTIIKLESASYNLFYGVQGEPGGTSAHYFNVDDKSIVCQIIGHDNCASGPINNSTSLTYLSHGFLSAVNLEAVSHKPEWFTEPYKPVPLQGGAQSDSQATSIDQLRSEFNALLANLRAAGTIKP